MISPARALRSSLLAHLCRLVAALLVAGLLGAGPAAAAATSSKRPARAKQKAPEAAPAPSTALHPAIRTTAIPRSGATVSVNPPPLLWPTASLGGGSYAVRLSRDPAFPAATTLQAEGLRWAMFNAHRPLEPGRWFWQYALVKPDQPPQWSERHEFHLAPDTRTFAPPAADTLLAAFPAGHPRILATAGELADLRQRAAGRSDCQALIDKARRLARAPLPTPEQAKPTQKGASAYEEKNFAKWASKAFAGDFAQDLTALAPAYLLTGDEAIGRAAFARALFLARLDPDGDTSPRVSDFADGSCMRAMALAYDSCFALLAPPERDLLRQAMGVRAGRFFRQHLNRLEGRLFNPHVWQHILMEATEIAFATIGELPEARTWVAWVYELWLNRFPAIAGDDGGWTEGLGYLGTNLETLLLLPQHFNRLTGADFYDVPWYRNAPYFHLYGWPVGSVNAGFGDGDHESKAISGARAYFVETLGRRAGNPHAVRYAEQALAGKSDSLPPLLVWHRLRESATPPPPAAATAAPLPLSRVFHDVGFVALHTDLATTPRSVFFAFNSCPYGAYGHMHPAQNAFNLMLGGERLFANSGYYIAFGDEHFRGWYHHSRGHNTVLIDGQGQVANSDGWGWIARHADSGAIAYTLGDASPAYGGTGLTRFRRHVALLRPATLVIYDELAADHAARWSWLLHSPARLRSASGGTQLHAKTRAGEGQVNVYGSIPLRVQIDDRFDPPADNWRGKKSGGEVRKYPNQWHATVEPVEKAPRMRYLAIFQLRPAGERADFAAPQNAADGTGLQLGPWTVQAVLDPRAPASLVIQHADGRHALAADVASLAVGGQTHRLAADETLLVEGERAIRTSEKRD